MVAKLARALLAATMLLIGAQDTLDAQMAARVPPEVAALAGQHPAEYYRSAAKLFEGGRKDDAVFLFYLGQLRYRVHLKARPDRHPDGDPALFASLSEVVGRPLNEYAFGDIPALVRIIDAVLAYDAANPDRFTPVAQFGPVHADIRGGLEQMKAQVQRDAETIRATRLKNGLTNRN